MVGHVKSLIKEIMRDQSKGNSLSGPRELRKSLYFLMVS